MREIKFRAWNNVADEMFYCGEDIDVIFMLGSEGIVCTDIRHVSPSGDGVDSMEHLKYMQYTGLKDKNSKDIYEGDIVKFLNIRTNHERWEIRCVRAQFILVAGSTYFPLSTVDLDFIEVIGNIHEHSHLLEGGK